MVDTTLHGTIGGTTHATSADAIAIPLLTLVLFNVSELAQIAWRE
jgi:hypothetical protein